MAAPVPIEVERFVERYISSLDKLEVLVLVSALPDREWSVDSVYQVVRTTPALVSQRLEELVAHGFFTRSGDPPLYRYAPRSDEVARDVSAVSEFYKTCRHRFVELIYAGKREQIREFSEAFRFKREKQ